MKLGRAFLLSCQLLAAHKLRTALSVSGLLIGVAAVMVMTAIGRGAERRVLERVRAMGTNLLVVMAAPAPRIAGRERQVATVTGLRPADADLIVQETPLAVAAAAAVSRALVARREGRNTTTTVTGTTPQGIEIRGVTLTAGRPFDELENREHRRVALLGATVAQNLFGNADAIGLDIRIGNVPFEVIGVAARRGIDASGADLDDTIVIPLETALRRLLNIPYVQTLLVQSSDIAQLDALEVDVRAILTERHRVRAGAPEPFRFQNQAELLRTERAAARSLTALIGGVAALALLAGSIGILAVMRVSVRERTREVGLRRALGARRRDIHLQFIFEAGLLAAAGALAGVIVGVVTSWLMALLGPWDLIVSWRAAVFGIGSSAVVGLMAGLLPARNAARLEPIAALRAL